MSQISLTNHIDDLPELPERWQWCCLGDLVDQSRGICYGIVQPGKHDPDGTPMINSGDVISGVTPKEIRFRVSNDIHIKYRRSTIQGGEILLTLVGANFGQVGIAPVETIGYNCSRAVGVIPVTEAPLFVTLCLRGSLCRHFMDNWANTTAQPTFNLKEVANLPIPLPPLAERIGIAHILGTLDDKIELNRKTNETLEAMAKALFKSWFVDFDPVKAKAEGRPTGLPAEISDLFPDSFEDSELGEIPSGWSISNLDDFIHLDSGLPYKGLLKGTGDAHLLTMGCADRALRFKSDGVHSYPSSIPARHLVNPGDIVICSHDLTQAREQLGAPFVVPDNFSGRIAAAATNTFIVRQKSPSTTEYLYQIFRSNGLREQMIASAKGSVILHISKESVLYYSFASPGSDRLISAYQSATDGMTQKIQEIGKGIYTLATIRDALLPKLISGEIRIPDAEKMLEEIDI